MSRDLLLLASALFTWGIGEGTFLYFQPLYLEQLGADPLQIGGILGGLGAAMTLAHIPAGYLADRIGRRPLMWTSWCLGFIATWIMALANSLLVFVAGLWLYGLTFFVMSPMNSYATAARGKLKIGQALLLISASYNLGMVFGPLLGGYKATRSLAAAQTRLLAQAANMGLAYGVTETVGSIATIFAPLAAGLLYTYNPRWIYIFAIGIICISIFASIRFSPASVFVKQLTPSSLRGGGN